jgi:hypothetical protein
MNAPQNQQNQPRIPLNQKPTKLQRTVAYAQWLKRWWDGASQRKRIIAVCGTFIALCGMCGCIAAADQQQQEQLVAQNIADAKTSTAYALLPTDTPEPTDTPIPIDTPASVASNGATCPYPAANGNPWCYTFFNTGTYLFAVDSGFCGYFNCISSFWKGQGYVVECADGMYSMSGGMVGSCSRHGGEYHILYGG